MTKEELEEKIIYECRKYMEENKLKECHFDFGLDVYPEYVSHHLTVKLN